MENLGFGCESGFTAPTSKLKLLKENLSFEWVPIYIAPSQHHEEAYVGSVGD